MDKNFEPPLSTEVDLTEGLNINETEEPLIHALHVVIRFCVRILAVLMTLVIMWSVADVAWVLYQRVTASPVWLLNINDILATFGAFMATLPKIGRLVWVCPGSLQRLVAALTVSK